MIGKIGGDSALVREALQAAQRYLPELASGGDPAGKLGGLVEGSGSSSPLVSGTHARAGRAVDSSAGADFVQALDRGLQTVDGKVRGANDLPQDLLTGKIDDFHEIAVQLKDAELSFRFAMEIRNKLIDAYREIMRMNV